MELSAIGGELNAEILTEAYLHGIFPWPIDPEYPMTWFSPDPRGILFLDQFRMSKSTNKEMKKLTFDIRFNHQFESIIQSCAEVRRKNQSATWIHEDIIHSYIELFHRGHAYCVGVYDGADLVGGLYGTCFGEIISGESMFHLKPGASKFALVNLINKLKQKGIKWLDTQMETPLLKSFGGAAIPRVEFIKLIEKASKSGGRHQLFS
jgi:leucyl/phenylalanyl-tRNA--protein transferase